MVRRVVEWECRYGRRVEAGGGGDRVGVSQGAEFGGRHCAYTCPTVALHY